MKNFIKSNYNMYPKKIYKENNNYFFFSNDDKIYILKTKEDNKYINNIVKISNYIYSLNKSISTFILNVNNGFYTKKDDYYIILLKYNDTLEKNICINDIIKYSEISSRELEKYDVINECKNIIDTLEKEMSEYNSEYLEIQNSLAYFVGMSENAIQLLYDIDNYNLSICHKIEYNYYNKYEFNNPFNLIKTNRMYDFASYFKYQFYNSNLDYEELYNFITYNKDDKNDLIFFFSMLLFQKEYFDTVKEILLNRIDEKQIKPFINKIENYKDFLRYIKETLKYINEIQQIEWLDK